MAHPGVAAAGSVNIALLIGRAASSIRWARSFGTVGFQLGSAARRSGIGASCAKSLGTSRTAATNYAAGEGFAGGLVGIEGIERFGLSSEKGCFKAGSAVLLVETGLSRATTVALISEREVAGDFVSLLQKILFMANVVPGIENWWSHFD